MYKTCLRLFIDCYHDFTNTLHYFLQYQPGWRHSPRKSVVLLGLNKLWCRGSLTPNLDRTSTLDLPTLARRRAPKDVVQILLCKHKLGPLSCDPDPPIGCLLWVRPSVELRRDDRSYMTRGIKLRSDELANLTRTINPASTEDLLSWLAWLEQSIQRNQSNVNWRLAELAGLTWTIKWKWSTHVSPLM